MEIEQLNMTIEQLARQRLGKMRILMCIVRRSLEEQTMKQLNALGARGRVVIQGEGTARPSIMDWLGMRNRDRSFIMTAVRAEDVPAIMDALVGTLHFDQPGTGIAFTVELDGHVGVKVLFTLMQKRLGNARKEKTSHE